MGCPAVQEQQVAQESLDLQVQLDQPVRLVCRVQQVTSAVQVQRVNLDQLDLLDLWVSRVKLDLLGL